MQLGMQRANARLLSERACIANLKFKYNIVSKPVSKEKLIKTEDLKTLPFSGRTGRVNAYLEALWNCFGKTGSATALVILPLTANTHLQGPPAASRKCVFMWFSEASVSEWVTGTVEKFVKCPAGTNGSHFASFCLQFSLPLHIIAEV